jgi:hypothetical protein
VSTELCVQALADRRLRRISLCLEFARRQRHFAPELARGHPNGGRPLTARQHPNRRGELRLDVDRKALIVTRELPEDLQVGRRKIVSRRRVIRVGGLLQRKGYAHSVCVNDLLVHRWFNAGGDLRTSRPRRIWCRADDSMNHAVV